MTSVVEEKLSLEEFHSRFGDEKPYFEFWAGEAVQKSMPTRLHSLIQHILVKLLFNLGFDAGQEITVKIVPDYEPIPDVIAAEGQIGSPYPTEPFEVAIEVLSPEDSFSRVVRKCHLYEAWGVRQVVVIDPQARLIWSFESGSPQQSAVVCRRGDQVMTAEELWAEVDRMSPPQN